MRTHARGVAGPPAPALRGAVRAALAALLAVVAPLCGAATATAELGVGTEVRRIDVPQALSAGGTYRIVPFNIANTGTEAAELGIVTMQSSKPGITVPASWLSFEPAGFSLQPGQSVDVQTTVRIPAGAAPGLYRIRLLGVPQTLTPSSGGLIGIGVGPTLSFTVGAPGVWQRMWSTADGGWMPWSALGALAPAVLVVLATAIVAGRRKARRRAPGAVSPGDPGPP